MKPFSALVPFCFEGRTPVQTFPCSKQYFVELCVRALGVQLKIREAFDNEGVRLKSGDVRRDIAALWKSFRTYAGDG